MHYYFRSSICSSLVALPAQHGKQHLVGVVLKAGPELGQPWVGVLGNILLQDGTVEGGDAVASHVVEGVLLIRAGTNGVRNGLDIVANLFVDHELDVLDLRIFDAVLISIVGIDLMIVSRVSALAY